MLMLIPVFCCSTGSQILFFFFFNIGRDVRMKSQNLEQIHDLRNALEMLCSGPLKLLQMEIKIGK